MRIWKWYVLMMERWKNEIWGFYNPLCASLKSTMRFFKILYALLSILFQFGRILTKVSDLTYVASKWYVLILESWKNWIWGCFTSLCTSVHIPFYSNLDESGWIWTKPSNLTHVTSIWYFSMMKSWKNEIWGF